jgi:GNAT superfamily N-acetyltransferase
MYHARLMMPRDLSDLARVEAASFGPAGLSENGLDRLRATRGVSDWTAIETAHQTPVGAAFFRVKQKSVEVLRLVVHPNHRRCGVGRLLLGKATAAVSQGKRESVSFLLPDDVLPGAHRWLQALGWRMAGRINRKATQFYFEVRSPALVGG